MSRVWPAPRSLVAILVVSFIVVLSIQRLNGTPYEINFSSTFRELVPVLASTAIPAIKLWTVWAIGSAIIAGAIVHVDPGIGSFDAVLGGAAGVWMISFFLGELFGPIGLFKATLLRLLLLAGIIWLIWRRPLMPQLRVTSGQKLALISFGLLTFGLLPLQLGSPVAAYMDVLTYPAAVQRILSFHIYLPFNNDAFGCWGARAQTPALELFYAALALAGGVQLGVLAHSQILLPMAALVIFATYRLGLTAADDIAGGCAALFLFFTTEFRRLTGMRGTAVAFALVAVGLAFLFDRERRPMRFIIGCTALGLAIPSHAIDGVLAMLVAGVTAMLYIPLGKPRRFVAVFWGLLGASLFALPGIAVGLDLHLAYIIRIGAMPLGLAVIVVAARWLEMDEQRCDVSHASQEVAARPASAVPGMSEPLRSFCLTSPRLKLIQSALIMALILSWIYLHGMAYGTIATVVGEYPLLSLFAFGGVAAIGVSAPSVTTSMLLFALLLEPAYEAINHVARAWGGPIFQSGFGDIGVKLQDYWCPYFLAVLAGVACSLFWKAKPEHSFLLTTALLVVVIYPWDERLSENYNYVEHSIAEEWGIDYGIAMRGFWLTTEDSRWTEGRDGFALINFMWGEIGRGLVTSSTHVLHLAHDITVLGSMNRYSAFTGINDDPVVDEVSPMDVGWIAGSRVRRTSELPALLAARPQYILDQTHKLTLPPRGYDEVLSRGSLSLYRRRN